VLPEFRFGIKDALALSFLFEVAHHGVSSVMPTLPGPIPGEPLMRHQGQRPADIEAEPGAGEIAAWVRRGFDRQYRRRRHPGIVSLAGRSLGFWAAKCAL